jgi:hypothetical protein
LGYESLREIKRLADCDDEFTQVDPLVVIYDTFTTGTCKIYVEETIPISTLLLARYFGLDYKITIMEDIESNPRLFSSIKVRPYEGKQSQDFQPLGCSDLVEQRLKPDQRRLIQIYMIRMGVQSSASVCDEEWLEAQTKAVGKVLMQQKPVNQERATPLGSQSEYATPK